MTPWNQKIPSRKNKKAKFCTFLEWLDRQIWSWKSERQLERNFDSCLSNGSFSQDAEEDEVFSYFLEISQTKWRQKTGKLANIHIRAYFEYISIMAVKQRFYKFKDPLYPEETWETYGDLARDLVNNSEVVTKFYQRYQKRRNNCQGLENFLIQEVASELKNQFYRLTGYGKYSPWYELKIIGKKPLKKKLSQLGIQDESYIEKCFKVRDCLYEVYSNSHPNTRWLTPSEDIFQQAFEYAEVHGFRSSLEEFKNLIETCLQALIPPQGFILRYQAGINPRSSEAYQNDIETQEEEQFSSEQYTQVLKDLEAILLAKFRNLQAENQLILSLHYALDLSDRKIGEILEKQYNQIIDRSTVCRWRNKGEQKLLEAIGKWIQQKGMLTPERLKLLEKYLKEYWLKKIGEAKILATIVTSYQSSFSVSSRPSNQEYYRNWLTNFLNQKLTKKTQIKINNFINKIIRGKIENYDLYP